MDIETLRYFKKEYESRKLLFMSQEQHWSWLYCFLYYVVAHMSLKDIDGALRHADITESISKTRH